VELVAVARDVLADMMDAVVFVWAVLPYADLEMSVMTNLDRN